MTVKIMKNLKYLTIRVVVLAGQNSETQLPRFSQISSD